MRLGVKQSECKTIAGSLRTNVVFTNSNRVLQGPNLASNAAHLLSEVQQNFRMLVRYGNDGRNMNMRGKEDGSPNCARDTPINAMLSGTKRSIICQVEPK